MGENECDAKCQRKELILTSTSDKLVIHMKDYYSFLMPTAIISTVDYSWSIILKWEREKRFFILGRKSGLWNEVCSVYDRASSFLFDINDVEGDKTSVWLPVVIDDESLERVGLQKQTLILHIYI